MIVTNAGPARTTVTIVDNYTGHSHQHYLEPGHSVPTVLNLKDSSRWYDVLITVSSDPSFVRHYAGHVENGRDSISDPLIGRGEV